MSINKPSHRTIDSRSSAVGGFRIRAQGAATGLGRAPELGQNPKTKNSGCAAWRARAAAAASDISRCWHGSRGEESRSFGALLEARARVLVRTGDRSADGPRAGGRQVARQLVSWRCKPTVMCAPIGKDGVISYIWVARATSASLGRGLLRLDQHEDRSLYWHKISTTPTSRRSRPS
ncbi:hypothetical protein T492DRAFT_833487 [Pavlovales sp. CCMP2436]|nr:hypothetical protein T492DRAFT_833487 [Pavlovales sp. CCMP2436]